MSASPITGEPPYDQSELGMEENPAATEPRAAPEAAKKQPFQTSPGDKSPPSAQKIPFVLVLLDFGASGGGSVWLPACCP